MFSRARSFWFLGPSLALGALSFAACSEEPRSVAGSCEDVPLYRNVYDAKTDTWIRISVDGGPLTAEENERLESELNKTGPRCLTPVGTGTSQSSGGSASSDAASGGSDAASD